MPTHIILNRMQAQGLQLSLLTQLKFKHSISLSAVRAILLAELTPPKVLVIIASLIQPIAVERELLALRTVKSIS